MENHINVEKITVGKYIAITVKMLASLFYQDVFIVDGFRYLEDMSDIIVSYRINGKRKPVLKMSIIKLFRDRRMIHSFSREDVGEIAMFYGRLVERKFQEKVCAGNKVDC